MASIYWNAKGATPEWIDRYPDLYADYPNGGFVVRSGDLGFSVVVFTVCACITLGLILIRRHTGGELGGSRSYALKSSVFLVLLWLLYVTLSTLAAYGKISSF